MKDMKRREAHNTLSRKRWRYGLRLDKEMKASAFGGVNNFPCFADVLAEHFYLSTFILRFICHGAIPPFSAAACKGDVTPQSSGKAEPRRKNPECGPGAVSSHGRRTDGEWLKAFRRIAPDKTHCKGMEFTLKMCHYF